MNLAKPFHFEGVIEASKSLMNRALICSSFFNEVELIGDSQCDDVRHMKMALKAFRSGDEIWCGEGGTTFRFLALRLSREAGESELLADQKLLNRPQCGLIDLLHQLGVEAEITQHSLKLSGHGWKKPEAPLEIDMSVSSQFASALVLSAWSLDFDLEFILTGEIVSEDYFAMTISLVKAMGMNVQCLGSNRYLIPSAQKILATQYQVEADVSSTFAVTALAALGGQAKIQSFTFESLQPDIAFLDILNFMRVPVLQNKEAQILEVGQAHELKPIDYNIKNCPDLFPVLAALCAFANGTSRLYGAPHLVAKESNRIEKVAELFRQIGVEHQVLADGMVIHGVSQRTLSNSIEFNPSKDHRLVMAASLFNLKKHCIQIADVHCVDKSFPAFREIAKGLL